MPLQKSRHEASAACSSAPYAATKPRSLTVDAPGGKGGREGRVGGRVRDEGARVAVSEALRERRQGEGEGVGWGEVGAWVWVRVGVRVTVFEALREGLQHGEHRLDAVVLVEEVPG